MSTEKWRVYEYSTRRTKTDIDLGIPDTEISNPEHIALIVRHITRGDARENFILFLLDNAHKILGYEVIAIGGLHSVDVHPREVFRAAIVAPAQSIIVAHNHPSNSCHISKEDRVMTRRLVAAGEVIGIPLVDHVVVTDDDYVSLNERGLLKSTEREIDDTCSRTEI